jgi:hypothetical protein
MEATPMTASTLGARDRTTAAWPGLVVPLAVGLCVYGLLLVAGNRLLNDPDSYGHLAVGRWIIEHRAFPTADPFSFTANGAHWIAKEWLSQILYAGAVAIGGWGGMVVLAAAAIAVAFAVLTRFLAEELAPLPAISLAAVAFAVLAPHALARPHALALPVMTAFVAELVRAVDRGRRPSLWLLPLMVLWANLHGGFTLGLLLTVAAGLDAIVSAAANERPRLARTWIGFAVALVIAACITPYGPESILVTFRVLGLGPALSIIGEWRPADFSRLAGLELCLLVGIGLALRFRVGLPPIRILILLGLLHLALSAERNGELLGLLVPLLVARPIALQYPEVAAARPPAIGGARAFALTGAIGFALAVAATAAVLATERFAPNPRVSPEAAVAVLRQTGESRVLNDYDFGGYLVYAGVPSFIDGRTELYGSDFVLRDQRAVTLTDLPDFLRLLDEYRIGATLLSPRTPAVALLDRLPGWKRIYSDDVAVVHQRTGISDQ